MTHPATEAVVEARGLGVTLGGRPVVRDVDLAIRPGEVVALTGGNGSGKSTLVRVLLGLLPAATGDALLFGTPLGRFREWTRVSYVPQRSSIATGVPATVREVVASGRLAHRRPFLPAREADRSAVREAIAAVDLTDRSDAAVGTLSGGQQQRVLIARALAGGPELLVLDEPNAGVDLVNQDAIAATIADRVALGATVLVVLHELGPFEPLLTRMLVMRQGRLVHDGPPDATLAHGDIHHHDHAAESAVEGLAPGPGVRAPLEGGRR